MSKKRQVPAWLKGAKRGDWVFCRGTAMEVPTDCLARLGIGYYFRALDLWVLYREEWFCIVNGRLS